MPTLARNEGDIDMYGQKVLATVTVNEFQLMPRWLATIPTNYLRCTRRWLTEVSRKHIPQFQFCFEMDLRELLLLIFIKSSASNIEHFGSKSATDYYLSSI